MLVRIFGVADDEWEALIDPAKEEGIGPDEFVG